MHDLKLIFENTFSSFYTTKSKYDFAKEFTNTKSKILFHDSKYGKFIIYNYFDFSIIYRSDSEVMFRVNKLLKTKFLETRTIMIIGNQEQRKNAEFFKYSYNDFHQSYGESLSLIYNENIISKCTGYFNYLFLTNQTLIMDNINTNMIFEYDNTSKNYKYSSLRSRISNTESKIQQLGFSYLIRNMFDDSDLFKYWKSNNNILFNLLSGIVKFWNNESNIIKRLRQYIFYLLYSTQYTDNFFQSETNRTNLYTYCENITSSVDDFFDVNSELIILLYTKNNNKFCFRIQSFNKFTDICKILFRIDDIICKYINKENHTIKNINIVQIEKHITKVIKIINEKIISQYNNYDIEFNIIDYFINIEKIKSLVSQEINQNELNEIVNINLEHQNILNCKSSITYIELVNLLIDKMYDFICGLIK